MYAFRPEGSFPRQEQPLTSVPPRLARLAVADAPARLLHASVVSVLGVPLHNLGYREGLAAVERLLARHGALLETGDEAARSAVLCFCNANTLDLARRDPAFRRALERADLCYGDGTGVRLAAAMRGVRMRANLNGTDLVPDLLEGTVMRGRRCFLLGGDETTSRRAAAHFQQRFPAVTLVGHQHGFHGEDEAPTVVRAINEARPDVLLVGMGHPRQEMWIDAHVSALRVPLVIAVGGLFAYWGNGLRRASRFARRTGFEWVGILLQQPHKLRRYLLGGPRFLLEAAWTALADVRVTRVGRRNR